MNTLAVGDLKHAGSLLKRIEEVQHSYTRHSSEGDQKSKGQFFTPISIATFMAGLLPLNDKKIRLLDPGAGMGVLSASVCERILMLGDRHTVHIDMFETDPEVLPILEQTAGDCQRALEDAGHEMTYRVLMQDFVLSMAPPRGVLFSDTREPYDAVITNPPYFKISKQSSYAQTMPEVVHGQPNIYAIFLAVSASLLRPGGCLSAITPRSFCNGLYFRAFRRWFFDRMTLDHAHLFQSRTDAFREASVLQESIVTLSTRSDTAGSSTVISHSAGRDLRSVHDFELPAASVIDPNDFDRTIFLPESKQDAGIVRFAQLWGQSFQERGLRISTGPVVMFRAKEFLRDDAQGGVPLLSAHNVKCSRLNWPFRKAKWPLAFEDSELSRKYLLPTRNYVLVKRFSAKEERRRLTAGCLIESEFLHRRVAIENHLNYIYHDHRELTACETLGVAAIFNSALFDRYFRAMSGNTQVNATEIRSLRFPGLAVVSRIGKQIGSLEAYSERESERIVMDELGVDAAIRGYLKEKAA